MGMLKFNVPHTLTREDAKARVEELTRYWAQKHGVQISWAGESASFAGKVMGVSLQASIQVTDREVAGEATDPGLLLRGQARRYLEEKFKAYLDPTKTLAELKRGDA